MHQVPHDTAWGALAVRLIRSHGPEMAARIMCQVLDELGPGKISVPMREKFFRDLWGSERDALIVQLAGRPDWRIADIAATMGVSRQWVRRIVARTAGGDSFRGRVVDTDR
ncbi:helix-turn-helix domain-containing protein [Pseudoxanthomonas sp. USHLN014]|uniref:helix-turn-helix domain-containing protein n=1 Tax=Pseudoxanthomonas sp. USHLN014 TaxID=3081297 RepID=UPI00301D127C